MSAFHVVVRPRPAQAPTPALSHLYGLFDVVVDGVNVTARIGDAQVIPLLAELAHAVTALTTGRRDRTTIQLATADETWELGLEADGPDVLVTVYRCGPCPEVAVFERRVSLEDLRRGTAAALLDPPASQTPKRVRSMLRAAHGSLVSAQQLDRGPRRITSVNVAPRTTNGFSLAVRGLELRTRSESSQQGVEDSRVERADLHALLMHGEVQVQSRGHSLSLGRVPVFLVIEQLAALADEVLEAWELARPLFRRLSLGGVRLGIRKGPGDTPMSFSVGAQSGGSGKTFPAITAPAFIRAVTRLVAAWGAMVIRHDHDQRRNLRLTALQQASLVLEARVDQALTEQSRTNPEPDSYRSFAPQPRQQATGGRWSQGGSMRFLPRWVATVPNIDLMSTFLCGDRMILGAERETACVHTRSGQVIWRKPTQRAAAVVTPAGLVRLHPDGRTVLLDLDTGRSRFSSQIEPRAGGGATGAVVHTPGLPRLLILAEGDRRVTALDLGSGDVRWRYTRSHPSPFRFRRAGRLLLVVGSDPTLTALDVVTGEVVWRVRGRLPFTGDIAVDHDSVFALSGTKGSPSQLAHLDTWTGQIRWTAPTDDRHMTGQAPLVTPQAIVVPTRDRRGVGARSFDRATGAELWAQEAGLSSPTTAWLAVDETVVANSAAGSLLCLEAATGIVRYQHLFSRHVDADQPRRLEPILRSGALFVPQHQVHVVRPRDGEVIGVVPSDLIPDLVRVDEHCAVYVAEESGHVAAFHTAPRLTLVE